MYFRKSCTLSVWNNFLKTWGILASFDLTLTTYISSSSCSGMHSKAPLSLPLSFCVELGFLSKYTVSLQNQKLDNIFESWGDTHLPVLHFSQLPSTAKGSIKRYHLLKLLIVHYITLKVFIIRLAIYKSVTPHDVFIGVWSAILWHLSCYCWTTFSHCNNFVPDLWFIRFKTFKLVSKSMKIPGMQELKRTKPPQRTIFINYMSDFYREY